MNISDTVRVSASTVQSYLATNLTYSDESFQIPGDRNIKSGIFFSKYKFGCQSLRDEILENFQNVQAISFCEKDWNMLKKWKWDENITDNQAQMLTIQVRMHDYTVLQTKF